MINDSVAYFFTTTDILIFLIRSEWNTFTFLILTLIFYLKCSHFLPFSFHVWAYLPKLLLIVFQANFWREKEPGRRERLAGGRRRVPILRRQLRGSPARPRGLHRLSGRAGRRAGAGGGLPEAARSEPPEGLGRGAGSAVPGSSLPRRELGGGGGGGGGLGERRPGRGRAGGGRRRRRRGGGRHGRQGVH